MYLRKANAVRFLSLVSSHNAAKMFVDSSLCLRSFFIFLRHFNSSVKNNRYFLFFFFKKCFLLYVFEINPYTTKEKVEELNLVEAKHKPWKGTFDNVILQVCCYENICSIYLYTWWLICSFVCFYYRFENISAYCFANFHSISSFLSLLANSFFKFCKWEYKLVHECVISPKAVLYS